MKYHSRELGVILDSTRLLHKRAQNQKMGDAFILTWTTRVLRAEERFSACMGKWPSVRDVEETTGSKAKEEIAGIGFFFCCPTVQSIGRIALCRSCQSCHSFCMKRNVKTGLLEIGDSPSRGYGVWIPYHWSFTTPSVGFQTMRISSSETSNNGARSALSSQGICQWSYEETADSRTIL